MDDLDLARVVGPAAVIDLSDVTPNEAIDTARLAPAAEHLRAGEIAGAGLDVFEHQPDLRGELAHRGVARVLPIDPHAAGYGGADSGLAEVAGPASFLLTGGIATVEVDSIAVVTLL